MSLVLSGNGDITGLDPALFQSNEMGFLQSGTGAVATTVQAKLRESVSVFDFIPEAQRAAIIAGTSTYNCTDDLFAAAQFGETLSCNQTHQQAGLLVASALPVVTQEHGKPLAQFQHDPHRLRPHKLNEN